MLGSDIGKTFIPPINLIGRALQRIADEMHTANQLRWLEIRSTAEGFAYSDGGILIQVGRKVGAEDDRG